MRVTRRYTDLKHFKVLFPYGRHGLLFIEGMAIPLWKAWPFPYGRHGPLFIERMAYFFMNYFNSAELILGVF